MIPFMVSFMMFVLVSVLVFVFISPLCSLDCIRGDGKGGERREGDRKVGR